MRPENGFSGDESDWLDPGDGGMWIVLAVVFFIVVLVCLTSCGA